MTDRANIFETHYQNYLKEIRNCAFEPAAHILNISASGQNAVIPFLGKKYQINSSGITDESGQRPDYAICVILAKYLLNCPDKIYHDPEWTAFKDFNTNISFFSSETTGALLKHFQDKKEALAAACHRMKGEYFETGAAWDVSISFTALPRIHLLVLFNDRDEDFPPQCQILFEKHANHYLDPESLIMTSTGLTRQLIAADKKRNFS